MILATSYVFLFLTFLFLTLGDKAPTRLRPNVEGDLKTCKHTQSEFLKAVMKFLRQLFTHRKSAMDMMGHPEHNARAHITHFFSSFWM